MVQFLVVYFFFVETSNLTLEETEHVFNSDHPVRESIRLSRASRLKNKETKTEKVQEAEVETHEVKSLGSSTN